jgi:NitT/TauT family transport system substrate-binding protein/sulfonate transport system substrate-binding protein
MHTLKLYVSLVSLAVLLLLTVNVSTGVAADLFELKTSGQAEICTFLVWDIIQKGWDKEAGLKITQSYFESGAAQVEALPSKQWVIATSIGAVPSIVAAMRYGSYVVAVGDEDSFANACLVRPNSPILKATGANPNYPKTYGSAATVKGKTVLVTTVSSGHYALATWLKRLGLKEKDVVVKNMDQGQIMAAFESGVGDIAVVWEPHMFVGMSKGWKMVNEDSQKGANQINTVLVEKAFADEHPDILAKFLKLYMRRIALYKPDSSENIDGYVKFLKDWAGVELSKSDAALCFKWRPMYAMNQQLKVFDTSKGQSEVQKWFVGMGDFFVEQHKFTREEMDKVLQSKFLTDKFLKMVAAMK